MAQAAAFPTAPRRQLSDKLQEIALRSQKDIRAFDALADLVLERLNAKDRAVDYTAAHGRLRE